MKGSAAVRPTTGLAAEIQCRESVIMDDWSNYQFLLLNVRMTFMFGTSMRALPGAINKREGDRELENVSSFKHRDFELWISISKCTMLRFLIETT